MCWRARLRAVLNKILVETAEKTKFKKGTNGWWKEKKLQVNEENYSQVPTPNLYKDAGIFIEL